MYVLKHLIRNTTPIFDPTNNHNMITKENQELHLKMIRSIENIITLKNNVAMGCEEDEAELEKQEARIPAMKAWANSNGTTKDVLSWISSRPSAWGLDGRKFIASEMYDVFAN